jgi:hypothetical protein
MASRETAAADRSRRGAVTPREPRSDGNNWLIQEVTHRLPGRVDAGDTTFTSSNDLAAALRRAAAAHGEHEKRNGGQHDANWPDSRRVHGPGAGRQGAAPVVIGGGSPGEHYGARRPYSRGRRRSNSDCRRAIRLPSSSVPTASGRGSSGSGTWPWTGQAGEPGFPVIPVLLIRCDPGLGFLKLNTWVDLSDGANGEALANPLRRHSARAAGTAGGAASGVRR